MYAGRAGGSDHAHKEGGGNPQCLSLNVKFYKTISGAQKWGICMYGAEYEQTDPIVNSHNTNVPCGMCHKLCSY